MAGSSATVKYRPANHIWVEVTGSNTFDGSNLARTRALNTVKRNRKTQGLESPSALRVFTRS
jgi:hypothetical protein